MFHHNKGGTKKDGDKSAKTFLNVGSGQKPHKGKHGIKTSAPMSAHHLDSRHKAGYLK